VHDARAEARGSAPSWAAVPTLRVPLNDQHDRARSAFGYASWFSTDSCAPRRPRSRVGACKRIHTMRPARYGPIASRRHLEAINI